MVIKRKLFVAKAALVLAAVPFVIRAYETGPDPRRTAAPGDVQTACLGSGCHSGSALNGGPGNVKIVLPNGNTYTPGTKQHILVQISDSTRQKFGFEMTARLASDLVSNQAGSFAKTDDRTEVICDDGSFAPCSKQFPVQFVEHNETGYKASTAGGFTYEFDWTPPATNLGNVTMYVAANAGPGGAAVSTNANVYTANVTLTPSTSAPTPTLTSVQDAESARTTVVPGEWLAIYGSNLAGTSRTWATADFNNGNNLPTSLSGVSVKFGGLAAAVFYISSAQLDVQAPSGIAGTVPVVVTRDGVDSAPMNVTVAQNAPSLFLYTDGLTLYPAATHLDGSLIGDPATVPGTTKAKGGETVVFYANGIGPSPSGTIIGTAIPFAGNVTVNFGSTQVVPSFAGLVAAGEYQLNVNLPSGLAAGSYNVTVSAQGQTSSTPLVFPVQ